MEITDGHRTTIQSMIGRMQCRKGFECCQSEFQKLCKVRSVLGGKLIECLEDDQKACKFAVDFGSGHFCECPLRDFLLKTLNI